MKHSFKESRPWRFCVEMKWKYQWELEKNARNVFQAVCCLKHHTIIIRSEALKLETRYAHHATSSTYHSQCFSNTFISTQQPSTSLDKLNPPSKMWHIRIIAYIRHSLLFYSFSAAIRNNENFKVTRKPLSHFQVFVDWEFSCRISPFLFAFLRQLLHAQSEYRNGKKVCWAPVNY